MATKFYWKWDFWYLKKTKGEKIEESGLFEKMNWRKYLQNGHGPIVLKSKMMKNKRKEDTCLRLHAKILEWGSWWGMAMQGWNPDHNCAYSINLWIGIIKFWKPCVKLKSLNVPPSITALLTFLNSSYGASISLTLNTVSLARTSGSWRPLAWFCRESLKRKSEDARVPSKLLRWLYRSVHGHLASCSLHGNIYICTLALPETP